MNTDVVIIGAGPAGIFTALEMIRKGSHQKIVMVEKGQAVENRRCPITLKSQRTKTFLPFTLISSTLTLFNPAIVISPFLKYTYQSRKKRSYLLYKIPKEISIAIGKIFR